MKVENIYITMIIVYKLSLWVCKLIKEVYKLAQKESNGLRVRI